MQEKEKAKQEKLRAKEERMAARKQKAQPGMVYVLKSVLWQTAKKILQYDSDTLQLPNFGEPLANKATTSAQFYVVCKLVHVDILHKALC